MKRNISLIIVFALLLCCINSSAIAVTDEDVPVSKIDVESLAALEELGDDAIVDVDIWIEDIDCAAKRANLQKLIEESDSEFIRSCPVVDDLSELTKDTFHNIVEYNQYSDIFRLSRRLLYEELNNSFYQELTERYAIDATLVYASQYSPSIQLKLSKAVLYKIQYDGKIISIRYYTDGEVTDDETQVSGNLFENEFIALLERIEEYGDHYKELYYHRDSEDQIDWALVYFRCGDGTDEPARMLAADRIIDAGGVSAIYPFDYAVYDVAKGEFISVYELRHCMEEYPGLYDALWELNIGRPIGDADYDRLLTILDATCIQRYLVGLVSEDQIDLIVANCDGDDQVSILDVTFIQRKLAGII